LPGGLPRVEVGSWKLKLKEGKVERREKRKENEKKRSKKKKKRMYPIFLANNIVKLVICS